MASSEGDVIMADDEVVDEINTIPSTSTSLTKSESQSQPMRTDHDRQHLYFLPTQPVLLPRMNILQNVLSVFGLDKVHDRVRRVDPVTFEKINKMRKSYVNIAKTHHLAGKVQEVNTPGQWIDGREKPGLLDNSEEVWAQTSAGAREISQSNAVAMLAKLDPALQIAPGRLDDNDKWKKLLGDEYVKPKAQVISGLKASAPVGKAPAVPSPKLGAQHRTQRHGAKRSYDDASFAGYEDTYDDVMGDMSGANGGVMRKKARKDIPISQTLVQSPYNKVGLMAGGARQR